MTNHARAGRWMAAFAGGVSLIALATPAFAQNTDGAPPSPLAQPDQDAAPQNSNEPTNEAENLGNQANEASNEVIITATRRKQNLQDVPMSVDVVSGQQIQRLNIFDAKDVQQLSPGLELTNDNGRVNTATLRGINFDPDQGTSPSVDLYYNEAPIDAQTAFTAIYDLDQVEVLRGPQGALRGRTSPSGAITFRTRRADLNKTTGYVQGTVTEDHGRNLQAAVSVPIVPGRLAVRFAGLIDRSGLNQVRNVTRGERSRGKTESFRASVAWRPIDNLNVNFTYQYLNADNRQFGQVRGPGNDPFFPIDPRLSGPPADIRDRIAVGEGRSRFRNRQQLFNLQVDWDLGPVSVAFVGNRQSGLLRNIADSDSTNAIPGYDAEQFTRVPYPVTMGELRLLSNNEGGFWNWTLGLYYEKQGGLTTVDQRADVFFTVLPPEFGVFLPIGVHIDIPGKTKTTAISASSRFQFTDKLRLEVAGRLTRINNRQSGVLTTDSPGFGVGVIPGCFVGAPDPLPPGCVLPFGGSQDIIPANLQKTKATPLTGGVNLTYEASRDLTLYAAYGRSYRAATAGVAVPFPVSDDLVKTDPERSDSFEIGAKATFMDRRLSLNGAIFYQKFNGFVSRFTGIVYDYGVDCGGIACPPPAPQGPDGDPDGAFDFNYNGDATVKGIELTLAGQPTDNWDFSVAASYVKARWDNARVPCNDFDGDGEPDSSGTEDITGPGNVSYCDTNGRIADVPNFSLTANTEIRFPMGRVTPFIRGLFNFRPSVKSERVDYKYKSRQLLTLFVGVRGPEDKWELSAFARNVFNQQRITNISGRRGEVTASDLTVFESGFRGVNVTNPREFGLTGSFRF